MMSIAKLQEQIDEINYRHTKTELYIRSLQTMLLFCRLELKKVTNPSAMSDVERKIVDDLRSENSDTSLAQAVIVRESNNIETFIEETMVAAAIKIREESAKQAAETLGTQTGIEEKAQAIGTGNKKVRKAKKT